MNGTAVRTHVYTFQPRFHDAIKSGAKTQTVRGRRARAVMPGDVLSIRTWTGKAYRSKQERLIPDTVCLSVRPVVIVPKPVVFHAPGLPEVLVSVWLDGELLGASARHLFVRADGFADVEDFARHWLARPTPRGTEARDLVVIQWAPIGGPP